MDAGVGNGGRDAGGQVAVANQFLRETTPAKLSARGASATLQAEVAGYREVGRLPESEPVGNGQLSELVLYARP